MNAVRAMLAVAAVAGAIPTGRGDDPDKSDKPQPIRVTVVVVYATTENNVVDKKLSSLAQAVEKRHPELVGYRLKEVLQKSIPVDGSHEFAVAPGQAVTVAVDKPKDKNGRVGLTVTAPDGTAVSYTCVCDKFFPLVTDHKTPCGKTLVLAVGAKPCTGKGP
jgi:hypothetical protein